MNIPQNSMVGQQRQQISELQFDKFPKPFYIFQVLDRIFQILRCLDARIASALNKIIQRSHFKKKVRLEEQKAQQEDWFLRGRHITFMIYDYFRVTGAHDTVLDYADFILCFCSRW